MQRHRAKAVDSAEVWSLQSFVDAFEPHITPEVLVHLLVEVLGELEWRHRRGRCYGAFAPDTVLIHRNGVVELANERIECTVVEDLFTLATMFKSVMLHYGRSTFRWRTERRRWRKVSAERTDWQDAARIHPRLKTIMRRATATEPSRRYESAWLFRAELLSFLASLGIESEPYFIHRFIHDPIAYNQTLERVIIERECKRISESTPWSVRHSPLPDLQYLLEISPGSPQALRLLRWVKQGRKQLVARLAYVAALVTLVLIGGSVIVSKLRMPVATPLVIEIDPAAPYHPGQVSRGLSSRQGSIEIEQKVSPLPVFSKRNPEKGKVALSLDSDARVYLDTPIAQGTGYRDGDSTWLTEGSHTVTVMKPGYPTAMAQIQVKRGHVTELAARATVD